MTLAACKAAAFDQALPPDRSFAQALPRLFQPREFLYFFLLRSVMPYPGFGIRSTSVVCGRRRASSIGINFPLVESRPRGVVLLSLDMLLTSLRLHISITGRSNPNTRSGERVAKD